MTTPDKHIQIPPLSDAQPHQLEKDVTFQWLQDGQVASIALSGVSREAIDAYVNAALMLLKSSPEGQTVYMLLDISGVKSTTPYFKSRLEDVKEVLQNAERSARAAIVLPPGFGASVFLGFRRLFSRRLPEGASDELFKDRDKALQWLLERLEQDQA